MTLTVAFHRGHLKRGNDLGTSWLPEAVPQFILAFERGVRRSHGALLRLLRNLRILRLPFGESMNSRPPRFDIGHEPFGYSMRSCGDTAGHVRAQIAGMDHDAAQHGQSSRYSEEQFPLQRLTGRIIAACFVVYRVFGYGFLESVYRRALAVELQYQGVPVAQEVPYELFHRGVSVGFYRADLVADSRVIVEAKTGRHPDPVAPKQLENCLKAAHLSLGLVVDFLPTGAKIKRVISSRDRRDGLE